jgi:acetyl-CoA C-acetyltransferase
MSQAPHAAHLRDGVKMGDSSCRHHDQGRPVGRLQRLPHGQHGRERRRQWQITREEQDEFAVASQNKAEAAQKAGKFKDEIVPVTIKGRKGDTSSTDEYIRHGATARRHGKLRRPSTRKARSPPATPPASMTAPPPRADERGGQEARHQAAGPHRLLGDRRRRSAIMGTGPIPASRKALEKAGWTVADLDLVEANEAFAAQACAVNKDWAGIPSKVNVNGGAIAIGHPIGASGARVLTRCSRDAAPRRQEGPRHAVHRRRHGRRHVRRARLIVTRHRNFDKGSGARLS